MNEGGFDLVTASGDASSRLIRGKKVQPINVALIPSYKTIDPRLQKAPWHYEGNTHYGVPYQWGWNVLMYNTTVFKDKPPTSWTVVFEETTLPDGKSNKGRVQAFDGPIYIADAALYLMKKNPALGIKDPYELNEAQYKAALDLLRGQRKLVGKYWHDAFVQIDDFTNEGVVASQQLAVPGQHPGLKKPPDRHRGAGRRRHRLGRLDHDARRRQEPELRLHVARAFAEPEAAGRPGGLVRLGAGGAGGLQGQQAADRRRLRDSQGYNSFEKISFWKTPTSQVRDPEQPVRAVPQVGVRLHRRARRPLTSTEPAP